MENAIIKKYGNYNFRRYSKPWIATVEKGKYNFKGVGTFTGDDKGSGGDLVVFEPVSGVIYAYGQKDYRGGKTENYFAIWDGEQFVKCDKLGRTGEN